MTWDMAGRVFACLPRAVSVSAKTPTDKQRATLPGYIGSTVTVSCFSYSDIILYETVFDVLHLEETW